MQNGKVSKARHLYRAGDYPGALNLYHTLGSEIDHKLFYANVALCLDCLQTGGAGFKAACLDLVGQKKFDILGEIFARNLVVSLTSYPARIKTVAQTIQSILAQSLKPRTLVLWLAQEQFAAREKDLPPELLQLKDLGLVIEWCEDIRSYKKLIPALRRYPDKVIVTADDDVIYERDWLAQLLIAHIQNEGAIICHRAHHVSLDEKGGFSAYRKWPKEIRRDQPSFASLFTGCGGVLYPPGSLHKLVLDQQVFTSTCPHGDDLWFWGMAVLNGTKIQTVKDSHFKLVDVPGTQETALWKSNVLGGENDKMLRALDARFPEIRLKMQGVGEATLAVEPQVSIIVPVFNTDEYLATCLDSILAQNFQAFEVLCIDDGSTDAQTLNILNRYDRGRDPRVRVIRQANSGPATARNTGLRNAKGAYIAFVDSDDYISEDYIGSLLKSAQRYGSDMAVARQILCVEIGSPLFEKESGFEQFRKVDAQQLAAQAIVTTGAVWNKLYKREFLLRNGIQYLDGMRCQSEDNYFSIMAMVIGHKKISLAGNATYYYRQHGGGITKNITRESFNDSILVYEKVKERLKSLRIPDTEFWLNVVNQRALKDLRWNAKGLANADGVERLLVEKFSSNIDVVCIADEKYVVPTLVFLESVKRSKRKTTRTSITVLVPQGSRKAMKVLEELSGEDFSVKVLEVETAQFANLHKYKEKDDFVMASPSAMFKFIIPLLFGHLDRILYIDTDLIVRKDLLELFMTSMEDKYLCAIPDLWSPVTDREDIKKFQCYFNSGVMLMNLARIRKENLSEKLIETKRNTTNFNLMDQDIFNEVCNGQMKPLDIKFNFLPVCYKRHKHRFDLNAVNALYGSSYTKIEEIAADPVVAHWAGSDKPWVSDATLFADEWLAIYRTLKDKGYVGQSDLVQVE
jgi:lipopolysaccharide biosynthesis glycosyltransferase